MVKGRRLHLRIQQIQKADDTICTAPEDISAEAVSFYTALFAQEPVVNCEQIIWHIPILVSADDNSALTQLPLSDEIKDAVWHLDPHSASGPDGFDENFYRSCWPIIHKDVVLAVHEFFLGVPQPRVMASALITLIPKKSAPATFSDYRPICLTNFISKVCTRIVASRLCKLLPRLISPEQTGFLPGTDISTQVLLAREMIHMLDRGGSQLCLKLDMMKAFDRVSWEYLELIFKAFVFLGFFTRIILNHLRATTLAVLITGQPSSYFRPHRGVKQGDPLSPLLFILAAEGFSRGLKALTAAGQLQPFRLGRVPFTITHLAYADDLLIFLRGTQRNLQRFHTFLTQYEAASGQKVNFQKSSIIPSAAVTPHQRQTFATTLGMRLSNLPFRYLGSYLHKGIPRAHHCVTLLQHIDDRLQGWHSKLLSTAGRLVLLQSVIAALPIHIMAGGGIPKSVIKIIHRKMATFYWGPRHHWVSWSKLTKPQAEGGIGLRDLNSLQHAFYCRIWWSYHQNATLWSRYMHAKYGHRRDYLPRLPDSPIWKIICRIHPFCLIYTDRQNDQISWLPNQLGDFSLKSAYEICRTASPKLLSASFIWSKHHSPAIKLFLWRIFNSALPFEDYLGRYIMARPTQCPFCKSESASVDHVFLYCPSVRSIWCYFASELHCPLPTSIHLRQYLLSW